MVGEYSQAIWTSYGIQPEHAWPKVHVNVAERHIGRMKASMHSVYKLLIPMYLMLLNGCQRRRPPTHSSFGLMPLVMRVQ